MQRSIIDRASSGAGEVEGTELGHMGKASFEDRKCLLPPWTGRRKRSEKIAERNITQEGRNRGPLVRSPGVWVKRVRGRGRGSQPCVLKLEAVTVEILLWVVLVVTWLWNRHSGPQSRPHKLSQECLAVLEQDEDSRRSGGRWGRDSGGTESERKRNSAQPMGWLQSGGSNVPLRAVVCCCLF